MTASKRRDEARKQLATEITQQQLSMWELDHQKKRSKDYQDQMEKLRGEIAMLQSDLPRMSERLILRILQLVNVKSASPDAKAYCVFCRYLCPFALANR